MSIFKNLSTDSKLDIPFTTNLTTEKAEDFYNLYKENCEGVTSKLSTIEAKINKEFIFTNRTCLLHLFQTRC